MHVDLSGTSALVTGATRGIGYEVARQLGMNGAKVIINAHGGYRRHGEYGSARSHAVERCRCVLGGLCRATWHRAWRGRSTCLADIASDHVAAAHGAGGGGRQYDSLCLFAGGVGNQRGCFACRRRDFAACRISHAAWLERPLKMSE